MKTLRWVLPGLILLGAVIFAAIRIGEVVRPTAPPREARRPEIRIDVTARLKSTDDLLEYVSANPSQVSLAAWAVGDEKNGIFVNAAQMRPVASSLNVLVLAAYAEQVRERLLDPKERVPLKVWSAFALPRTDEGAHEAAVKRLREARRIHDEVVELRDIADAMMVHADGAATDYLMHRVGREALAVLPTKLSLESDEPPMPSSGQLLTWRSTSVRDPATALIGRYRSWGRARYVDETWKLSEKLRDDPRFRALEMQRFEDQGIGLSAIEQRALAKTTDVRGTARSYARVMEKLAFEELPGADVARRHLEWPMRSEPLKSRFEFLGATSGALPGILTAAYYGKPKGEKPVRVLALFCEDLPDDVWVHLRRTSLHQQFGLRLIEDDAFFARAKERFSSAN